MANMVQTEIMQDHSIPIIILELIHDVPCDIVIHFGEVLCSVSQQYMKALAR